MLALLAPISPVRWIAFLSLGLIIGHLIAVGVTRSFHVHGGDPVPSARRIRLFTAVVFAVVGQGVGLSLALPPLLLLVSVLISVSIIDWSQQRIPSLLIKPAFVFATVLLTVEARFSGVGSTTLGLVGAIFLSGLLGIIHLLSPEGMGKGDVRLAALLGLFIGWGSNDWYDTGWNIGLTLLLASIVGLISAVIVLRRSGPSTQPSSLRGMQIPFAPALCLATVIVVFGVT